MEVKHVRELEVSWKNTFNPHFTLHNVTSAFEAAKTARYPFISWNGWVYDTNSNATELDRIVESKKLPT